MNAILHKRRYGRNLTRIQMADNILSNSGYTFWKIQEIVCHILIFGNSLKFEKDVVKMSGNLTFDLKNPALI